MAPKKTGEPINLVDRKTTPFNFHNFQIGPLNKKIFFWQLFTEATKDIFNTELMDEILAGMEKSKISGFVKFPLSGYSLEHVVEFLYNSDVQNNQITSTVGGKKIIITEKSLQEHFNIGNKGLQKLTDEAPDARVLCVEWRRPGWEGKVNVSIKTKGLFAEYEALAEVVAKNIMGQVGSHDTMSANKFTIIDWIVKGKRVNWIKIIWPALVHQVENFQV